MNNRRKFLAALGAGAFVAPFSSFAQQQGNTPRVGFLSVFTRPTSIDANPFFGGFMRGMRELGYVEGKNIVIEWRFADNKPERLPSLAGELVKLKVDVIVAHAIDSARAAQKATTAIPIVVGNVSDAVGSGLVKSLARPGGNITGFSTMTNDISLKYMELLLRVKPNLSRIAVLKVAGDTTPTHDENLKKLLAAGQNAGVKILVLDVGSPQEIESAFGIMVKEGVQALIFASHPLFMSQRHRIAELAAKNRLPFVSAYSPYAEVGALISYGPNVSDLYRRAATYVDKILKGAKPGDLPVEQPMKFEMFINGKTAKALGLTIPQSLLISADKVIE